MNIGCCGPDLEPFARPPPPVPRRLFSTGRPCGVLPVCLEEVRARNGRIVVVATEGHDDLGRMAAHELRVPDIIPELTPLLTVIPLQLLAYHIARLRGCDVDRPRNLAKSVTVE